MGEENVQPVDGQPGEVRTSAMAVAALILAITCVGMPVAVVLGILSLMAIGDPLKRLRGKGLAIASLVISGVWVVMIPILAILAGLLLPALARARGEARKAACKNNLRQIGIAVQAYSMDHKGQLPTTGTPGDRFGSLDLLIQEGYLDGARLFHCPSDAVAPSGMTSRGLTDATCSYFYDNTVRPDAASDTMIVYDESVDIHGDGRNVLFMDGSVRWLLESDFQNRLAAQKAANAP